jgi:hypothetical protein
VRGDAEQMWKAEVFLPLTHDDHPHFILPRPYFPPHPCTLYTGYFFSILQIQRPN